MMTNNIAPFAIDTAPPFELQLLAGRAVHRCESAWLDRITFHDDTARRDPAIALHEYWTEVHGNAVRELVNRLTR